MLNKENLEKSANLGSAKNSMETAPNNEVM